MHRLLILLLLSAAFAGGAAGCGDSGPSGQNAKAIEEFEDLGLSLEKAEGEVAAANREAAQDVRRDEARIRREVREEEAGRVEQKTKSRKQTPAQTAGFDGKYEEAYELGLFACAFHPLQRIAKEFHISPSSNELEVAEAYAEGYYGGFEQAAFEGCFDGIRKRQAGNE
jgi:hypothetical protein